MKSKLVIPLLIAGLLSIGAWRGYGQTGTERNVTYEYIVIEDPTRAMPYEQGMKKLNELGAHGWEIVGIRQAESSIPWLYLKRTK